MKTQIILFATALAAQQVHGASLKNMLAEQVGEEMEEPQVREAKKPVQSDPEELPKEGED